MRAVTGRAASPSASFTFSHQHHASGISVAVSVLREGERVSRDVTVYPVYIRHGFFALAARIQLVIYIRDAQCAVTGEIARTRAPTLRSSLFRRTPFHHSLFRLSFARVSGSRIHGHQLTHKSV